MSIRFKKEETLEYRCEDPNSPATCDWYPSGIYIDVPIQEWDIFPQNLNSEYTIGEPYKSNEVSIVFPELHLWTAKKYKSIVYDLSFIYTENARDWLNITSPKLNANREFLGENLDRAVINVGFQNLAMLPVGTHTASIIVRAYEKTATGKDFIEQCPQPIKVSIRVKQGTNTDPDIVVRNLVYNKKTKKLTGDNPITLMDTSYSDIESGIFSVNYQNKTSVILGIAPNMGESLSAGTSVHSLRLMKRGILGQRSFLKDIPILLNVVDGDTSDFWVNPNELSLSVSKDLGETKQGSATIFNPDGLPIEILLAPSFVENVRIEDNQLIFSTKTPTNMALGDYSGEIVLRSGKIERRVLIRLKVVQSLASDFRGSAYYFALDRNKISLNKIKPNASYINLILEMRYRGFGKEIREKQEYSYYYFRDNIEIYPGEEVQDFFIRCQSLTEDNITQRAEYQYHLAFVNIIVKEYDADDNELSESRLDNIRFAPGRRPKCFPIFTDFGKRRVFEQSKIRLNADILEHRLGVLAIDVAEKDNAVWAFNLAKEHLANVGNLEFVPFPEPKGGKLIHLFFENQNLVLEWFSCPVDYQRKFDFTHITDELTGEKFGALETENWVLNTGWILREEIELINALLKSRICFIVIGNQIIKARPMSKKNELYNTAENLYSMDLEFNIKQNER